MAWLRGRWKQLRVLFRKERVEQDLDDEVRFHLAMEAEKYMREGMAPKEARRQAMIAFGGVERFKEQVRGARWTRWIEDVVQDVRYGTRMLAAKPDFTAAAVVTLALGIGATTVMFGVVDALFLSPPPSVRDADELVRLYIARDEGSIRTGPDGGSGSYPDYLALHENARGFEDVAAVGLPQPVDLGLGPDARQITGQIVTENFFGLLGVRAERGRFYVAADARGAAPPVVVIAHRFWRDYFGEAADVVGRTLLLNGTTATVIGVAAERFSGIDPEPVDVWVPAQKAVALRLTGEGWMGPLNIVIDYIGRLERGVPVQVARASAETALRHAAEQVPELDPDPGVILGPFITARGPKRSEPASVALWVSVATGLLLLAACANVANLLLARAATRRREIAVRLSLGVSRRRLVRQLLTESLLLAAFGCVGGLVLAFLGAELAKQFPLPPSAGRLNGRMLAFAGATTAVTGVLFGLAPALQALRTGAVAGLKDAALMQSRGHGRLRGTLVAMQAALGVVTLAGAGLFLRSLTSALAIDPGIELDRMTMVSVDLENVGYTRTEQAAFRARARERLLAIPNVEGVTTARIIPLSGSGYLNNVDPPGPDSVLPGDERLFSNWVAPGFARAMGMQIIAGRDLTEGDDERAPPVALVSAELARLIVPGGDVVGLCMPVGQQRRDGGCTQIVGALESVRHTLFDDPTPYLFLPWAQHPDATPWDTPRLYVRTNRDPQRLKQDVRAAVQGLAPDLPFVSVEPMSNLVQRYLLPLRIGAMLSTLFGMLALALVAVGLYGVLGYFVAERTPEIGVRRALGAQDGDVVGLIVRQAVIPVTVGGALGLAAAIGGGRLLEALLFGVSSRDPVTLVGVFVFLGVVALLASYLPARRAVRVDPRSALREE